GRRPARLPGYRGADAARRGRLLGDRLCRRCGAGAAARLWRGRLLVWAGARAVFGRASARRAAGKTSLIGPGGPPLLPPLYRYSLSVTVARSVRAASEAVVHRLLSRLSAALRHSRFRRLRDENGSVLFVSAAAMLVLCGVTGLGVDVGMWYRTKRAMQNAADSAAMAAALDNSAATYQAAGKAVAAQYGFVDGSGGVNVAVANAQSCPGGGTSNCYTATVSQQAPQYFSQVLGIAAPTLSASATASRRRPAPTTACLRSTRRRAARCCSTARYRST